MPKKNRDDAGCTDIQGEKFYTQTDDDVSSYSWWEVFCFPYIICSKFWDCCVTICAGTNQCLIYLMLIQWCICKISKLTTPDPIIFPYYFYMFCQVILMTALFAALWMMFGRTVVIPFFISFYQAFYEEYRVPAAAAPKNATRMSFRKYCFRKGEIFDTPMTTSRSYLMWSSNPLTVISSILNVFVYDVLY